MLWTLRRRARPLLRPLLALAALLWLATALAPCFQSMPHCEGMDGAIPCAHAAPSTSDCDTACLQNASRNTVAAIASFPVFAPLLLAVVAFLVLQPVVSLPIVIARGRAPDTPLHLRFSRLLI